MTRKTMKDCRIVNGFTESGRFLSIRQSRPFTKITTKASAPTANQIFWRSLALIERKTDTYKENCQGSSDFPRKSQHSRTNIL